MTSAVLWTAFMLFYVKVYIGEGGMKVWVAAKISISWGGGGGGGGGWGIL